MTTISNKFFSNDMNWEVPRIQPEFAEQDNAYIITKAMKDITTPEEFDTILERFPGYPLNTGGRLGWTVLACAITQNSLPLVRHILDKAPELVNGAWHDRGTPYIITAVKNIDIFMEFVKRGANVNLATPHNEHSLGGRTALEAAASDPNNIEVTRYLLKNGGLIYNSHINEVLEQPCFSKDYKQSCRDIQKNILAAMHFTSATNRFLNDSLCHPESREKSLLTSLSYNLREKIWGHITTVDVPLAYETRVALWPELQKRLELDIPRK